MMFFTWPFSVMYRMGAGLLFGVIAYPLQTRLPLTVKGKR